MKFLATLAPVVLLSFAEISAPLSAQTADFPKASDFPGITRPADSYIIGAMRIDNDEYLVPLGPMQSGDKSAAKSVLVTGSVDTLAYSGPTTASTLTTYGALASQLKALGYTQEFACVREACGNGRYFSEFLSEPTVKTIHSGSWGGYMINSLWPSNDDVRIGTFHKDGEYIVVLAALNPGERSGAFLVRLSTPPAKPVLRTMNRLPKALHG